MASCSGPISAQTAMILKQMRELGMKQRVFGSHRTMGDQLLKEAGALAEGMEAVYPFDPTREDTRWIDFNQQFEAAVSREAGSVRRPSL